MRRIPILPTVLVFIAASAMIGLGIWQVQRATWKEALLAQLAANATKAAITFPEAGPVASDALFRRSSVSCLRVAAWRSEGGHDVTGKPGTRHIAECVTGGEGPGALIDMGVSTDPRATPAWAGGTVAGVITTEPDHTSLISGLFGTKPVLRPMLVAKTAAPGLTASAPPRIDAIPNNHRAYAVQWFIFAALALIIYAIALSRRHVA